MNPVMTFEEYMLNEGRVVFKRKYTDLHPEKSVSSTGPVREKILSFVKERKEVTHEELMEFIKSMNEESGGQTSRKWVNKNTSYFRISEKGGVKSYALSAIGKRVHEAIMKQKTV